MLTYMTANFSKFSGETFQVTYGTASAPYLAVRSLHHQCGQFPLTKWHSSHVEFVESYTNNDLNPITDGVTSALGVVGSEARHITICVYSQKRAHNNHTAFEALCRVRAIRPTWIAVSTHYRRQDYSTGTSARKTELG